MGIRSILSKLNFLKIGKKSECCNTTCKICQTLVVIVISTIVSIIVSNIVSASKVKSVINKDPKFIIDALQNMEANERKKSQEQAAKSAPDVAKKIVAESKSVIGNKNGSKVIIEFFDYNCGHCKRQAQELQKLITENRDVKVILADLPILSEESFIAAQVGVYVALNNNDKLTDFYEKLNTRRADKNAIKEVLKLVNLPANYLEKAQKDSSVRNVIQQNYEYAKQVGVQGTPALIINGKFVGGMVTADDLKNMIK